MFSRKWLLILCLIFLVVFTYPSLTLSSIHSRQLKAIKSRGWSLYKWIALPINRRNTQEIKHDPTKNHNSSMEAESVRLALYAGAEFGLGQYLVEMEVGNPPQKLRLVLDTGSDITWVKCKNKQTQTFVNERGFEANLSNTFKPIGCDTNLCKQDLAEFNTMTSCPVPGNPCMYNFSYGLDNEEASVYSYGKFGNERVSLKTITQKVITLPDILLGCSSSYGGNLNLTDGDGMLGLGLHPYSFSLHATDKFGGKFSYCLVDHLSPINKTSYLLFGENKEKPPSTQYTAFKIREEFPNYWVNVKDISIGNRILDIPPTEKGGGTFIDSGTTATFWTEKAYGAIMNALIPSLEKKYPRLESEEFMGDGASSFEYCFNSTVNPLRESDVPRLEIQFTDGARFTPHVKSYIIDHAPGVHCIGFLLAPGGTNILGNILQQNFFWEFDLHRRTIGFSPSPCS